MCYSLLCLVRKFFESAFLFYFFLTAIMSFVIIENQIEQAQSKDIKEDYSNGNNHINDMG